MLKNSLTQLLQIKYPIIQAPMAGGITTTELVTSVSNYGGLGSVGAGYMSPDALRQQIKEIKVQTEHNFGVNIFVPSPFETTTEQIEKADQYLQRIRHQLKMDEEHTTKLPTYSETLDTYHKQVEVVLEERVPVVSFTFGLPEEQIVTKLKDKGIIVMATATTVAEAIEVERLGIDVVIAQGSEAGGHRGNFILPTEESLIGVMSLVPQIVDQVNLPVIAAGGIMDGRGIIASLVLGAQAAQMGTAFLMTKESGTHPKYK
ncbi:MAG TPA: nitronate monooxygenase, partial [Pseudogracilibacillus sp.]|nr:nitronate monooxygenase [Pseudogracilibacillus sp.]